MNDYEQRARTIVAHTLTRQKRFIVEAANTGSFGIKRMRFQLPTGTLVALTFNDVETLFASDEGRTEQAGDLHTWNELEVTRSIRVANGSGRAACVGSAATTLVIASIAARIEARAMGELSTAGDRVALAIKQRSD